MTSRSPLAPEHFPDLPPVAGVTLRTARAGYKAWDRDDLLLMTFDQGTTVAGVTTRSACPSPEVEICRQHLPQGQARALVVSAGNSNAFTGAAGRAATDAVVGTAATAIGCAPEAVFVSATGVIGVPLPIDKAQAGLMAALHNEPADWQAAANAILTTDTFAKGAVARIDADGTPVTLVGIAKGSGMIAPDMATMLAYVVTDAAISASALQHALTEANLTSFSCITVDSDTSTSDTLLAFATGAAGNAPITDLSSAAGRAFAAALRSVCLDLALQIVRDGEGASKLIAVHVIGAVSDDSAFRIAQSIANSPLVKTAIAGEDANWGRVVMAVGKAGEPADRDRLGIAFGGITVAANGAIVPGYDEAPVAAHLRGSEIRIDVTIGLGDGQATVWTCDLTHGYISINADYRS